MFKLISCINNKYVIGNNNDLLYHLKSDLQNFKRMTLNNVVIMGRKTFESLPSGALPNRINIIITSDKNYTAENCLIFNTIEDCVKYCKEQYLNTNKELFIIGGGSIYKEFLERDLIDVMYITHVDDDSDGNISFPLTNFNDWTLFYSSLPQQDKLSYTFKIYKK